MSLYLFLFLFLLYCIYSYYSYNYITICRVILWWFRHCLSEWFVMKSESVFNQSTYPLSWNYQMIFNRYCSYSHLSNNYPDLSLKNSLKMILLTAGMPYFMFEMLGYYYPVFSEKFMFMMIFCLVWLWMIFWFILELVELYIMMVYVLDPKYIKLPKSAPNFIKEWYKI